MDNPRHSSRVTDRFTDFLFQTSAGDWTEQPAEHCGTFWLSGRLCHFLKKERIPMRNDGGSFYFMADRIIFF